LHGDHPRSDERHRRTHSLGETTTDAKSLLGRLGAVQSDQHGLLRVGNHRSSDTRDKKHRHCRASDNFVGDRTDERCVEATVAMAGNNDELAVEAVSRIIAAAGPYETLGLYFAISQWSASWPAYVANVARE
jgi:hypothetical protein